MPPFIAALKRFLPMLKLMASLTRTPLDDLAVKWLEALLDSPTAVAAATADLKAAGQLPPGI